MSEATRHKQKKTENEPLFQLGAWLKSTGYEFVTVTPATHARVMARNPARQADTLEDIFGWNLPFATAAMPEEALNLLRSANAIEENAGLLRSKVRFSTLAGELFVHSGYPTHHHEAVFFGPDTYRFGTLIEHTLQQLDIQQVHTIADIGCGSGAGGIIAEKILGEQAPQLLLTDINPLALRFAGINAKLAGVDQYMLREGDLFAPVGAPLDLIVANPPYLMDDRARAYRHGGDNLGSDISQRIVLEGLPRLDTNGIMILYTAAPVVDGHDTFRESIAEALDHPDVMHEYREIDPDVFGEELENPAYADVDRLAAVSLVVQVKNPLGTHPDIPTRERVPEVPALLSA